MKPQHTTIQTIRDEFVEIWNERGDIGLSKDEMFDFFFNRFSSILEGLEEDIDTIKVREGHSVGKFKWAEVECDYNKGINSTLNLIRDLKDNLK